MIKTLMSNARKLSWAHLAGVGAAQASEDETDTKDDKDKGAKGSKADDDKTDPPKDDDKSAKGAKADDDERKKRDDESDDEYSKRMKALDDDEDKKAKGAKGSKADDDSNADDDKDEEMRGSSAAAAARRREQARCAAIFASPAAGKNPVLAAKLAFETRQPRDEAIALLEGTPAPAAAAPPADPRARHAARATNNPNIAPPGAPEKNAAADVQNLWAGARKANQALRR